MGVNSTNTINSTNGSVFRSHTRSKDHLGESCIKQQCDMDKDFSVRSFLQ